MARRRIIYQSQDLFVSPTGGSSPAQLFRIQDSSLSVDVTRTDVNEFGKLAALSREILEAPSVSTEFSYFLMDGENEKNLGFTIDGVTNCLSGILANDANIAEKNIYIVTVPEGYDAHGIDPNDAGNTVIGIGNAFVSNYSVNLAVGEIPTASVSMDASNVQFSSITGVPNPAIRTDVQGTPTQLAGTIDLPAGSTGTLSYAALRPGDITMDFGDANFQFGGAKLPGMTGTANESHVQSVSIEIPMSRTPQQELGKAFAFSRELDVPITVTMNVSVNLADITDGSLVDLICSEETPRDIVIKLYNPCGSADGDTALNMAFTLKGATLDSQSFSSSIGDNATADLTFSAQIGGANDALKGLFISGISNS